MGGGADNRGFLFREGVESRSVRPGFACLLSLLVFACSESTVRAAAPAQGPQRAVVRGVNGNVKVKRSSGDVWVDAMNELPLYENDKLSTASGAAAEVVFVNGTSLTVGEDALIAIAETRLPIGRDKTDVTVLKGQINAALKDATRQSLTVSTPTATVRSGREIVFQ